TPSAMSAASSRWFTVSTWCWEHEPLQWFASARAERPLTPKKVDTPNAATATPPNTHVSVGTGASLAGSGDRGDGEELGDGRIGGGVVAGVAAAVTSRSCTSMKRPFSRSLMV